MDLIPYSDSDEESNEPSDTDEIIEITQKPVITQQLNFKPKHINSSTKNNNETISLDFGTDTTHKSLFDSLPIASKTSLHQNIPTKKKKKSKKSKKKKKHNKKRKLEQISLIDMLPQPKHKKLKISNTSQPQSLSHTNTIKIPENETNSNQIETKTKTKPNDHIETNNIRKQQAEIHRKYTNPLATFSISNTENQSEIEQPIPSETINKNIPIQFETNSNDIGVQFQTASSIYRVDNNNNNVSYEYENSNTFEYEKDNFDRDNEKDKNDRIKYLREQFKGNKKNKKNKKSEEEEVINISHSDLIGNKKPWMRTFEIDDITRQDIKHVTTNTYNAVTGEVEAVKKYTKTQKRKHQINTLAYEAQEKALQLAMQKSASYKTKAETQAKYGW